MRLVRWEPFHNAVSAEERMNWIFNEAFRSQGPVSEEARASSWAPAVDIFEREGHIVLKAELPGIEPKDVDIQVENGHIRNDIDLEESSPQSEGRVRGRIGKGGIPIRLRTSNGTIALR